MQEAISYQSSLAKVKHLIDVYIPELVFGHSQLYVAMLRVKSFDNLNIQIIHSNDQVILPNMEGVHTPKKAVFCEILQ